MTSKDFGQTLIPFHLGSLGGRREKDDHFTLDVVTNYQEEECGVCNPQSDGQVRASDTIDLKDSHPSAHMMSICVILSHFSEL